MINTETMRVRYEGDGTQKDFQFDFKLNKASELEVHTYVGDVLAKVTNFTITPRAGSYPTVGGTVTYPASGTAAAAGTMIIISRAIPLLQQDAYNRNDTFSVENIEHTHDTEVMEIQQVADRANRSIRVPIMEDSDVDPTLPKAEPNKGFYWDESGKKLILGKNPKEASDEAAASAAAAKRSETNAGNSANAAHTSEANAKESETNAAESARIATAKTEEVVSAGNNALSRIDSAKTEALDSVEAKKTESVAAVDTEKRDSISEMEAKRQESVTEINGKKVDALDAIAASKDDALSSVKDSKDAAAASAKAAQSSANAAKVSETNAKASETASKASETASKASETAAKDSEVDADASMKRAIQEATNASASAAAAKNSETNSKASETNAKTSETNAKASETTAKTEADRAKKEADRAEAIAGGDILTKAEAAKTYLNKSGDTLTGAITMSGTAHIRTGDKGTGIKNEGGTFKFYDYRRNRSFAILSGSVGDFEINTPVTMASPNALQWKDNIDNAGQTPTGSITKDNYTGTAAKATSDADGNNIGDTYIKKTELPKATTTTLGGIIVGSNSGFNLDSDGTLRVKPATTGQLGGIKVGDNLTVGEDGTLSSSTVATSVSMTAPNGNGGISGGETSDGKLTMTLTAAGGVGFASGTPLNLPTGQTVNMGDNPSSSAISTKGYVDNLTKLIKRNTAYEVGDIAYSPNLPSNQYLECTTAGTTGATEPDWTAGGGNS